MGYLANAYNAIDSRARRMLGVTRETLQWPEDIPNINTFAGEAVTQSSAVRLVAVWACQRLLSETIGTLPAFVFERVKDGKQRASDHPYDFLIHDDFNPEMDSSQGRELTVIDMAGWGNSAYYIERDRWGVAVAMWPLHQTQITKKRNDAGKITYEVREFGAKKTIYPAERIWHPMILPELTRNGLVGRSPIAWCRQAVGLGLGAEQYGARLFANDGRTTGVLEIPGKLGPTSEQSRAIKKQIQEDWTAARTGENRHKVAILDQDAKFHQISINPDDAQFLETRRFQVEEIARLYGIPPDMIGAVDKTSSWGTGVEQRSLAFVIYTIRPYLVKLEQSLNRALFTREERKRFFIEFNVDGLLRGDIKSRYAAYASALQWGWQNRNEVRALENLNPFDGGDEYYMPLNMAQVGEDPLKEDPSDKPQDDESQKAAGRMVGVAGEFSRVMRGLNGMEKQNGNHHQ